LLPPLTITEEDCTWIETAFDNVIASSHKVPGAIWSLGKTLVDNAVRKSAQAKCFNSRDQADQRESSSIIAAPFSAIIAVGVLVLPEVIVGITDASAMRRRAMPKKRKRSSTTAIGSLATPIFAVPTG